MNKKSLITTAAIAAMCMAGKSFAQTSKDGQEFDLQLNTITTAVPFLSIAPDSRATGMGDIGVATSPDVNSIHWNASKLAFAEKDMGIGFSYSPWLRKLGITDINLIYLTGFKKLNKKSAIGGSLRYFSLGSITFTDNNGSVIRTFNPNEFALEGAYAVQLSKQFSGGLTARYIYSNLTGGLTVGNVNTKPGQSFAIDISGYYKSKEFKLSGYDSYIGIGGNLSNVGAKMSYTNAQERDFLPANLRLGSTLNMDLDEYNQFSIGVDLNKLLVPSPAAYVNNELVSGRDNDVSVASGMFGAFSDAPGNVLLDDTGAFIGVEKGTIRKEELREINIGIGMEYWYAKKFAIRAGYFHEHRTKGNRKYFTIGAGMNFTKFNLDFSYLISTLQNNPLANTIRFSLGFNIDKVSSAETLD